jgi:hypothetical protein
MLGDFAGESSSGRVITQPKVSRRTACRLAAAGILGASGVAIGGELFAAAPPAAAEAGDLFAALKSGDVEAKVVARDQHHVRVFLKNPSKRPLSVKLPEVLAARPVLAQNNFFNPQGNGPSFNSTTSSQQPAQAVGGPMSTGSSRGFGNGPFNIPPESVREIKIDAVCLEHGKPNPKNTMPYELVKLEEVCKEPAVESLLIRYGQGGLDRDVVQAAAWNLANGLSWDKLAAMSEQVAINAERPIYTPQQLQAARQLTERAKKEVASRKKPADTITVEGQKLEFSTINARK